MWDVSDRQFQAFGWFIVVSEAVFAASHQLDIRIDDFGCTLVEAPGGISRQSTWFGKLLFGNRVATGLALLEAIEQTHSLRQISNLFRPAQLLFQCRPFFRRGKFELL